MCLFDIPGQFDKLFTTIFHLARVEMRTRWLPNERHVSFASSQVRLVLTILQW